MAGQRCLRVLLVNNSRGLAEALAPPIRMMGHVVKVVDSVIAPASDPTTASPDVIVIGLDYRETPGFVGAAHHRGGRVRRGPFIVALTDDPVLVTGRRAREVGAHLVLVRPVELDLLAGVFRRFGELLDHIEGVEEQVALIPPEATQPIPTTITVSEAFPDSGGSRGSRKQSD